MAKEGLGLEITELRLGLPGNGGMVKNEKKRVFLEMKTDDVYHDHDDRKVSRPTSKNNKKSEVVVGWPPVCFYRRKNSFNESKMYVKVSMDGTPFLRKVDINHYKGYEDLTVAFQKLFGCYGIGEMLKDGSSSEYIPIYEDKDGDWMLVGDVPWEMFIESCKRMRIMKKSETKGFGLHLRTFAKKPSKKNDSRSSRS